MIYDKKKIRGWKRHLKNLDQWTEQNGSIILQQLMNYNEQYAKIGLNSLQSSNIPFWFLQKVLDRFSLLYDSWMNQAQTLEFPTDIQLWIYEKNWMESELVIAKVENPGDRRNNYFDKLDENRKAPHFLRNFSNFQWESFVKIHRYYEKMDDLSTDDVSDLLEEGFTLESDSPEKCYTKIHDYVWVGRKI